MVGIKQKLKNIQTRYVSRHTKGFFKPTASWTQMTARDDSPAAALHKIVYTQTRQVEVQPEQLRQQRIISGLADPIAEPYKVLRTQVLQRMRDCGWRSLAVLSPTAGCGKTVTAINLAISIARDVNQTVLLVDLDLRRPQIHRYFAQAAMPGISDYLVDDVPLQKILFNPRSINRLVVLPGHTVLSHSSEMLSSPKMVQLIEELKSRYESRIVLLDMPPLLACDDSLAFAPYFDAALLVLEDNVTAKADLDRSVRLLEKTKLLGTTLNKASADVPSYSMYG